MKILTVIGARPQFVKAAVVSREIIEHKEFNEIIIHTGQHFDANMSDIFFDEMGIPKPNYNLDINGTIHGAMTGRMLEGIESICLKEKPEMLLVYGDTNSTLAGALAAKKIGIKVVHVEAGLRSFNMEMPEEINRILTDRISDVLCCPTETAMTNLANEGYSNFDCKIFNTGDVMEDAALYYASRIVNDDEVLNSNNLFANEFILATIHRQENTDNLERLREIFAALDIISETKEIILPLHPRTAKIIKEQKIDTKVKIIPPVGYYTMISLLRNCNLVMTDSGGLQKEAYFFNKFCITLRDQTEWVELVNNNYNLIVGSNKGKILEAFEQFKTRRFERKGELYGGGKAAANILKTIKEAN